MRIEGKIIVISGGSSGMGAACASHLVNLGAHVMVLDKNIKDHKQHENINYFSCDVTDESAILKVREQILSRYGIPRIIINCAGIAPARRMVGRNGAMPLSEFNNVISVNLIGTFNVMRLMSESMMYVSISEAEEERGVIINTASIAAYEGQIGQIAYSASKGGIVSMTLPAARELAQHAIRVNTIAPGLIETPLLANMSDDVKKKLLSVVIYPKRLGMSNEFASLAEHIITNSYLNGEVIRLDGAVRLTA